MYSQFILMNLDVKKLLHIIKLHFSLLTRRVTIIRAAGIICLIIMPLSAQNFPHYFELDTGETAVIEDFPPVTLISKKVDYLEKRVKGVRLGWVENRIGSASAVVRIGVEDIVIPVGYQNEDVVVGTVRIGVEVISDYEAENPNARLNLEKDARLRVAHVGKPLMSKGSHVYPLFSPWNNGFRNLVFLTACTGIYALEGDNKSGMGRYHDGFDFGTWEGKLVRSVCRGIVVSPDDYPELIEKAILYNKNNRRIGTNPFLVKHPELPLLYYYTHLSGLAKDFQEGETIGKGEILGYASNRGSSGGWHHLHFSMIHLDHKMHINPYPFIAEWYREFMTHYSDFLSVFEVYYQENIKSEDRETFERKVLEGQIPCNHHFSNSLPGVIHLREAVAKAPYSGLNHALFNQFALLKGRFIITEQMSGELWFGHTGIARLYLNGEEVYLGENETPYHRSVQPLQVDSKMIQCKYKKGQNEVVIAIEQTNPFWSFSIRPRDRLGLPLNWTEK